MNRLWLHVSVPGRTAERQVVQLSPEPSPLALQFSPPRLICHRPGFSRETAELLPSPTGRSDSVQPGLQKQNTTPPTRHPCVPPTARYFQMPDDSEAAITVCTKLLLMHLGDCRSPPRPLLCLAARRAHFTRAAVEGSGHPEAFMSWHQEQLPLV